MTRVELIAVVLWVGVVAYAVFGGADFGAGFWDLVAGGPERGAGPRKVIDHAIGPVWEANHVWFVFCLVMLWTAFPSAFTAITTTLTLPLLLAGVGIVLRGASFALRKAGAPLALRGPLDRTFAVSSLLTPFAMGAIAGGIASGRVPARGSGSLITSWLNPTSVVGGMLAVATCAYLAATFLVSDARRLGDARLVDYFARRAIAAALGVGVIAASGVFVLDGDAHYLFANLTHRALPSVITSVVAGAGALMLLVRRRHGVVARLLAIAAVATIIVAWGVAQYPFLLPTSLTLDQAASPPATLAWLIGVSVAAAAVVAPALGLLYLLDQHSAFDEPTVSPH